jgi:hypothetical protein
MSSNVTCIPKQSFSFENNFLDISAFKGRKPISSSIFHVYVGPIMKASFSLEVRVNFYSDGRYLGLYLKSHTPFPVRCSFKFTQLNQEFRQWSNEKIHTFNYFEQHGLNKFFHPSKKPSSLEFDSLNVKVEGILYGEVENVVIRKRRRERDQEKSTVASEVSLLLSSNSIKGLEKDVSISFSLRDEKLYAHSFILMLRSPVFRAMLLSDRFQESITKDIKIEDIEYDCFVQILNFIYTDECELHENTFDLLNGSIKYGIEPLEKKIEEYLLDSLNNENAPFCLYYSDLYRAESLKKNVLGYISQNSDCIKSEDFFKIIHSVQLQAEILKAVTHMNQLDDFGPF